MSRPSVQTLGGIRRTLVALDRTNNSLVQQAIDLEKTIQSIPDPYLRGHMSAHAQLFTQAARQLAPNTERICEQYDQFLVSTLRYSFNF
jgi:hypothetical protein